MFDNILVVCTGNICRSPLAEVMAQSLWPDKHVWSAGTAAVVGSGAHRYSVQVGAEHGIDLSNHVAQQITAPMMSKADLILAMDGTHIAWLNAKFPFCRGKIFRFLRWAGDLDIDDPYGRDLAAFAECHGQIVRGLEGWERRITVAAAK